MSFETSRAYERIQTHAAVDTPLVILQNLLAFAQELCIPPQKRLWACMHVPIPRPTYVYDNLECKAINGDPTVMGSRPQMRKMSES